MVRRRWSAPKAARRSTFDPADLNKNLDWKGKGKPTTEGSSRSCRRTKKFQVSSSRFQVKSAIVNLELGTGNLTLPGPAPRR